MLLTPEGGDLVVRHEDATEVDQDCTSATRRVDAADELTRDQKRVNKRRKHCVGRIGSDELSDTGVQELVKSHLEIHRAGDARLERESDDGVPGC